MEHKKAFLKISAFMDKELNNAESKEIAEHIITCETCRAELENLKRAQEKLLSVKHDTQIDPYFRQKLYSKLETPPKVKAPSFKWLPVPVALSLFVLIFSALMLLSPAVYGVTSDKTSGMVKEIAVGSIIPGSVLNLFAPANFIDFCNKCSVMMCACCEEKGITNCPVKGCKHE
ncbi:MAG: hypothetical protein CVV21_01345 [Candidatus Goldiibacteriota bacterium HGW-Goldbacteria-1]|jgi:predicted anti-sigma-YlaC factor YlaD|nr:MAG: hypothetical protein CVV21_01345 [Candidatus Goldiibacteriota bacterium HGW-Goldbacteria-1]